MFRTLKYTAGYPGHFSSLEDARDWMLKFEEWYNCCHRHSKIGYVTPEDRNNGNDIKKFETRNRTMEEALKKHPERFKGKIRKWVRTEVVYINKSVVSLTA